MNVQLKTSRKFVDADHFFEILFWKEKSKNMEINYSDVAKRIFQKVAQRGDEGLFADGWREMIQELNFSPNQYFLALRKLKQAGMIEKSKKHCINYYITHIQSNELINIPDEKKEIRQNLILILTKLSPELIPTESFILGKSKLGFAKLSDENYYEKLLNESKNNVNDAIIGDTALKNNLIQVSNNKRLRNKILSFNGRVMTITEFGEYLNGFR